MNRAAISMGRVLATLTSRVIYEEILQQRAQNLVNATLQDLEHDVKLQRAMQVPILFCCIQHYSPSPFINKTEISFVGIFEMQTYTITFLRKTVVLKLKVMTY